MNDSASGGTDQGNGPDVAASPLTGRKKTIYAIILAAGLIAAVWMGYRALVPADCGCTRDRKSPPKSQPGGPLVADFRVAALAYRGRNGVVDAIQAHAASLRSADYAFVTLSQVASAVRSGERLPRRTVAITLDTENKAIANDLLAFMRMSGIPVSLAVRPHLIGKPGMIGWDAVSELQSAGAELHAAVGADRGEADLLADLRRFARRLSPARIHVVSLDKRSNALTARLGARTGMMIAWQIGSAPAMPTDQPEETRMDRPAVRLLELDRIPVDLSETPATLVADVNKLTGQPDPEQMAAKHAGATSNGHDESSQAKRRQGDRRNQMNQPTRWVVVGYGMGWHHARYLEATDGLELRGVCEVAPDRLAKAVAEHPGIATYTDYDAVLADPDVDGVVVVTPHNTHAELAVRAMEAGKHTITDKAMCLSVAEAHRMIAARDRAGVMLSVFHNRRWDGDFLTVRRILSEYQLGRLYHIQSCVTDWGKPGGWRRDRTAMGGWMFDWGAHTLDQILLLAGAKPLSVYAFTHYRYDDPASVEDYINCTVTFEGGLTATTVIGYLNMIPMPRWYVIGEFGALQAEGFETPVRVRKLWGGRQQEHEVPLDKTDWGAIYANVAGYLAGREELAVRPEQLVPQIAIAEAAYRSVATGTAIAL